MFIALLTYLSINTNQLNTGDEWFNATWHYRVKLEVNANGYNREDWPVEYEINFTERLRNASATGTFDKKSLRLFEYDASGNLLYPVPFQFKEGSNYNNQTNAHGTLTFKLNGSTGSSDTRYYYVYFDVAENGEKEGASFSTDLQFSNSTSEFNVTNERMRWQVDTQRGENTSGLFWVTDLVTGNDILKEESESERTAEYIELTDGTYNYSFDLRNNFTLVENGPVRVVVREDGYETYWGQAENKTNQTKITKYYIFYSKLPWIKIVINITNIGNETINRSSTQAGAIAIDVGRTLDPSYAEEHNSTDPGSWAFARESGGTWAMGITNFYENGSNGNFFATGYGSSVSRVGIELNSTTIEPNASVVLKTALHFDGESPVSSQDIKDISARLLNDVVVTMEATEPWVVKVNASTEYAIYNRNETVLVMANVTYDPFNLVSYVNATINGNDEITLYDDGVHGDGSAGDKLFANYYNLTNESVVGKWNVTVEAFASDFYKLNESNATFNVTSTLNVSTVVINRYGDVNREVNATVDVANFLGYAYVTNATINCSFDGSEVGEENITSYNNGTYLVRFTAPGVAGAYTLNCSAKDAGNLGWDTDTFYTEDVSTNVSIRINETVVSVSNVTIYDNSSFFIRVNATNTRNGTAYNSTINLSMPSQMVPDVYSQVCGNVGIGESCVKEFEVTVLHGTSPGNYTLNATVYWDDKEGTHRSNKTNMTVEVLPNPRIRVVEESVENAGAAGKETYLANITLESYGNAGVTGISFSEHNLTNFTFEYIPSVANLSAGANQSVAINITTSGDSVPGYYFGYINVSSSNDGWDRVNVTIAVSGTNLTIASNITSYIAYNITWFGSESFSLMINTTNVGDVKAWDVNVSIELPQNFSADSTLKQCGDVYENGNCSKEFLVTIENGTRAGNYTINASVLWWDKFSSVRKNTTKINVTVKGNRIIDVVEETIEASLEHGENRKVKTLTVRSIGNERVDNVNFTVVPIDDFNFTYIFVPESIAYLEPGSVEYVDVNVSVPLYHGPGNFSATINVTTSNDGFDVVNATVEVKLNQSWTVNNTYCEKPTSYESDTVCDILITNLGNEPINFNLTPYATQASPLNYTWPSHNNFTIEKNSSFTLKFYYNISGAPAGYHFANYTLNALNGSASPESVIIELVLNPYVEPVVRPSMQPNESVQLSNVRIYANVTDRSGTGIDFVTARVYRPGGGVDEKTMRYVGRYGDEWYYELYYPTDPFLGTWGNSSMPGNYTVSVYAQDNTGTGGEENTSFYVYPGIDAILFTLFDEYERGNSGTIYYKSRDLNHWVLGNVSVNFRIYDPNGTLIYEESRITDGEGKTEPLPTFTLTNDAPLGNYTLVAFSKYYDTNLESYVSNETEEWNFTVKEETLPQGGIFARVETQAFWYLDSVMEFWIWVLDGTGALTDPDELNLTVYDPVENIYFNVSLGNPNLHREGTGVYTYQYAITPNTATGSYKAELRVRKGDLETVDYDLFRITSGGPYDVRLNLLEHEVYPGDYLDFEIVIINKGEYGQDVHVEYWVSDGTTWYYNYEDVFTPANQNTSLLRYAYIFTNQPAGKYYLNVKVNYSAIMPPARANASFSVIEKPPPSAPPAPPSFRSSRCPRGGTQARNKNRGISGRGNDRSGME